MSIGPAHNPINPERKVFKKKKKKGSIICDDESI